MTIYIERQSGQTVEHPTHWIYGQSSTTLSIAANEVQADDVRDHAVPSATPASLWNGVYYMLELGDLPPGVRVVKT
ncbi:hypothetical protein BURK1_01444 [Burkholderiales bacterium]|nr:hypothetical protein BURK1_01444 [Burkholderiales bacterium]